MADDLAAMTPDYISALRASQGDDRSIYTRSNIIKNSESQPEAAAAALPIARDQGLPLETVENNLPHFQKMAQWSPEAISDLRANSPVLYRFLGNPDNVRVAHKDVSTLTKIEKTLADVPRVFDEGADRAQLYSLRDKQMRGTASPEESAQAEALSRKVADTAAAQAKGPDAGSIMESVDKLNVPGHPLTGFFAKMAAMNAIGQETHGETGTGGYLSGGVEGLAGFAPTLAEVGKQSRAGALAGGMVGLVAGGEGPQAALSVPAGAAAGGVVGSYNAWRGQVSGQVYDDLLRWTGPNGEKVSPETARYVALGSGVLGGIAGTLPIHTALKTIPAFQGLSDAGIDKMTGFFTEKGVRAALNNPAAAGSILNIGKNYALNVATTGAATAGFNAITMYSEELAKHLTSPEYQGMTPEQQVQALTGSFIGGTAMGAITGLPGTMMAANDFAVQRRQQPHPSDVTEYIKRGTAMARQSELRRLSPAMFREFAGDATQGNDFYVPVEQAIRLYQAIPAGARPDFDEAMPDFQQRLAEGVVTGADVRISQADYFAHIADHMPADMAQHFKLSMDHISEAEYKDKEFIQSLIDEEMGQGSEGHDILRRAMMDQFENMGFTPDVASKYADLAAGRYQSMMARYGDNERAAAAVQAMADQLSARNEVPEFMKAAAMDKKDAMDVLISRARSLKQGGGKPVYPILNWLKQRGGLNPESKEAQSLRAMGITSKTVPGLYAKKGLKEDLSRKGIGLDDIPADEFAAEFGHHGTAMSGPDDNGYVNTAWLLDAIGNEYGLGLTLNEEALSHEERFLQELDKMGVDVEKDSNAAIKQAINDYLAEEARHQQGRLYQNEPGNKDLIRGYISFEGDYRAMVTLTKDRGLHTTIHELAHWFSFTQAKLAKLDERAAADWERMKKILGAEGQDSLSVEQEETFAKMFEAYAAEGRAPSVELHDAFRSFAAWIKNAYRRLTGQGGAVEKALGVALNDEVRDFMDRLIATDDQIEQLRSQPAFTANDDVLQILSKAEQERYLKTVERQNETAKERLLAKALREKNREYAQWYKDERAGVMREQRALVWYNPVYRAMQFLRHGQFYEGDPQAAPPEFKLSRKKTIDLIGKELANALPDAFYSKHGVSPDMAAEAFGFRTGQEFVLAMLNAEPAKAAIERMTNDEMLRRHGDMMRDGSLERDALDKAHNEYRAMRLEMEGRAAAARAQVPFPSGTNFKEAARTLIGGRTVIEAGNANKYYLAGKAAARRFGKAIATKDYFKAAAEKQKELLNHFLYREALKAREDMDKTLASWKKLRRPDKKLTGSQKGRMDVNFLYLARGILAKYGAIAFRQDITKFIENLKQFEPQAYEDIRVALEDNTAGAKPWKSLTLDEFRALRDTVDNITAVGKGQNEIMLEGQRIAKDELLGQLEAALLTKKASGLPSGMEEALSDMDMARKGFYSMRALTVRMEAWAKVMDGGHRGLFHDVFVNPIFAAKDRYTARQNEIIGDLYNLLGPNEERLLGGGKLLGDEIGYVFQNKGELIGMLLHTGNASNYEKLWRGRKWDPASLDDMIKRMRAQGTITKEDMDLVQSLWDVAEGLKPDAWKAFKEMYGRYPEEVTAAPIDTEWGSYRGGYWPAIVERAINEDAAIRQDRESLVASNATGLFPSTSLGPTKSRVESYAAPLSFDLNLLPSHIDKMLRITYIQPAVREVAKIALHKRFRDAMAQIDPGFSRSALVPYLWRTVNQITEMESAGGVDGLQKLNRFADALRRSAAGQALMYNIPNGIQQLTGLFPSIKKAGGAAMAEQLMLYRQDPAGFAAAIHEKSAFMRNRVSVMAREQRRGVYDIIKGKTGFQKGAQKMNEKGYIFYQAFQSFTDNLTWASSYNNALEGSYSGRNHGMVPGKAMGEAEAVAYADKVVRETQGSAEPESIATYEAGPAFMKLFTMFSSYWNAQANMIGSDLVNLARDYASRGGSKELFMTWLMLLALPGIASRAIYDGVSGRMPGTGDDDKKKWALWLLGAQVNQASGMVPFVGAGANALWNKYVEKKPTFNDSVFSSPVGSAASRVARTPGEIAGAVSGSTDPGRALMDTMYSLGFISGIVPGTPLYGTGLPLGQLGKPAGYMLDLATGHAKPKSPGEALGGLIVGPNRSNSRP